ncbi:hypothetical protein [Plasmodium yoelii yoelii]|uniref:Uncharacterized protein n=1 Tax=Plasmodium yoelii yoelii TaxID=73239 RepID=Q7R9L0_PLAYO|nr:hypothetical protein [Plasmodium yoelii yoelii]
MLWVRIEIIFVEPIFG